MSQIRIFKFTGLRIVLNNYTQFLNFTLTEANLSSDLKSQWRVILLGNFVGKDFVWVQFKIRVMNLALKG